MTLRTNRKPYEPILAEDINGIAAKVNEHGDALDDLSGEIATVAQAGIDTNAALGTLAGNVNSIQETVGGITAVNLQGTGMPNGSVAAPPGTYYTDTAGTNGAWRWLKKSGTGNTGWECVIGDTGRRVVVSWDSDGNINGTMPTGSAPLSGHAGVVSVRRVGAVILWRWNALDVTGIGRMVVPYGLRSPNQVRLPALSSNGISFSPAGIGTSFIDLISAHAAWAAQIEYRTDDPWPATLPGTPF